MALRAFFCLFLLGTLVLDSEAQFKVTQVKDTTYCVPSVEGLSRPKGLVIKQEILTNHNISSQSLTDGTGVNGEIRATRRREIKLKAPLVNHDNFKRAFKYDE